jgi:hypothetical protein
VVALAPNIRKLQNRGTTTAIFVSHKNVAKVGSASAPTGIQDVTPDPRHVKLKIKEYFVNYFQDATLGTMRVSASQHRRSGAVCQNAGNFERTSTSIRFAPRHALNQPGDIFFDLRVSACHNGVMAGKNKINR